MVDLGTLPNSQSSNATGINDLGQVVGVSRYITPSVVERAFRYTDGVGMIDLGVLPGQPSTGGRVVAERINNSGQVVGSASTAGGRHQAFRYTDGVGMASLGVLLGYDYSTAYDINDSGHVVGESYNAGGSLPPHAFLYTDATGLIDLNTLIDPNSGWLLERAYAINDTGWIVGTGFYNGMIKGYLLTPVPEPSALVLLAAPAVAVIIRQRRRTMAA
jgi:probable HAF family extracellular repeat protein